MDAPDLIERLTHDHLPLTQAVDNLRTLLLQAREVETFSEVWENIGDVTELLRDELLEHFGRAMTAALAKEVDGLRQALM